VKRVLRWWPFVPLVWLAVAVAVIKPGTIEIRENVAFEFSLLFYDPADIGAFVLRGANSSMGRLPGRTDEPQEEQPSDLARRLDAPQPPYSDRFYLEYPTATLLLFRLGFLAPCELPPAVADAQQYAVAHFIPRTAEEERIWSRFHFAAVLHLALMTAALGVLIVVLRRGYVPGGEPGPVWLAVLPGAVFFALNRFDVLPALSTALGFAAIGRNRHAWSGACFACGSLLKIYPVLFTPIILRGLGPRDGAKWLAGFTATILVGVGLSTAAFGWESTVRPVLVQLSRPLEETSWTLYGRVLPMELGRAKLARPAILAVAGLLLSFSRPRDLHAILRRCSVLLLVFTALAVFWSPQWVVWFLPLVVPLAARHRWVLHLSIALDLINYFQFPVLFWILWSNANRELCSIITETTIGIRIAMWGALAGGLLWCEFRHRSPERCPEPSPSA